MKSVLISIQPKWVEKICHKVGFVKDFSRYPAIKDIYEKTIEVRKTKPKLKVPFKCYIYCTKGKIELPVERKINRELEDLCDGYEILYWANGKVIGEFTCDNIEKFNLPMPAYFSEISNNIKELLGKACLSMSEAHHYIDDKDGYGWHISDLKIYDKPKELSEFRKPCNHILDCFTCYDWDNVNLQCVRMNTKMERPPQSWCYVEI